MVFSHIAWLVPVFPLLSFLLLIAGGRQWKDRAAWISAGAMLISFVLALLIFFERIGGHAEGYTWDGLHWLRINNNISFNMGFEINNLNTVMLVIVTLVSFLVNVYSKGYMQGDERISVYFQYVSLFTFSMLGLVVSVNLLEFYIFWELVGVCSFLLIGFWFFKPEAKAAAKKAFIVTRIGDVGLFIALIALFWHMPGHSLDFSQIHNAISEHKIPEIWITWIGIFIFIGAVGKSGQFPLHTWLPDAMEGPTPISALIHAATMVAAGVYLVARTFVIFQASPVALDVVAYVGGFTALFAAVIGLTQHDIKRVLAYSTVSQLGYMMLALGMGTLAGYTAGMFHLLMHACFKALLFLAAGSVIHSVHTQNIHEMGGLAKKMKITTWTFAIGTLALSGIVPFAGFWSKDAILSEAYAHNQLLFWAGLIAAFFTALYMARLFFLVFTGEKEYDHDVHESAGVMTFPMIVLAVLAAVGGAINTPMAPWFGSWLTGVDFKEHSSITVMVLSNIAGLGGIFVGWLVYSKGAIARDVISSRAVWLNGVVHNKFYIDELYDAVVVIPLRVSGHILNWFDMYVIDGCVRLFSYIVTAASRAGTRLQNGQVQTYGLVTLLGLIVLVLAIAGRRFIHAG